MIAKSTTSSMSAKTSSQPSSESDTTASSLSSGQTETIHIDAVFFEDARALFEDDFVDLVETYIDSANDIVDSLKIAQQENDTKSGYDLAHTLKGASANLGLTYLGELCLNLEQYYRDGLMNESAVKDLLVAIDNEVILTNRLIKQKLN